MLSYEGFHSFMEVVMSTSVYLPFALGVFALLALCYGVEKQNSKDCGRQIAAGFLCHNVRLCGSNSLICTLNHIVKSNTNNLNNFYKALSTAISIDCFEYQDASLSAVINSPSYQSPLYKGMVNSCAEKLLNTPSNSIHLGLIEYYMEMGQYEKAIEAAEKGVSFNYSNPQLWNSYFHIFYNYTFTAENENPFLGEEGALLRDGVKELYDLMLDYNTKLWEPIVPDENTQH
jgi:tetratricopeptide (TPR) repeat protein